LMTVRPPVARLGTHEAAKQDRCSFAGTVAMRLKSSKHVGILTLAETTQVVSYALGLDLASGNCIVVPHTTPDSMGSY
jgi:hypothetical protein